MKIQTSRFILSTLGTLMVGGLGFYALNVGDAVTAGLTIPTIGGIVGYYTYGKTKNNDTYMATNQESLKK